MIVWLHNLRTENRDKPSTLQQIIKFFTNIRVTQGTQFSFQIAEILALDLSDIDFTARKFQVIGKGNKQRWCFYNENTDSCLNNYIKYYRHSNIDALFTAQKPNQEYVSRLSYATAYSTLKNAVKNIPELEDVGFHHLRHTFASQRVGIIGIEELRALMGHEKIQTTLRYSKITSQRAQEVALSAFEKIPPLGQ